MATSPKVPTPAETYGFNKPGYSTAEVLAMVPLGRSTLLKLEAAGEIKPVRVGRRKIYLGHDLAALLERLQEVPKA